MAGDLTVGQLRVVLEADSSKFAAAMKDASADTKKLSEALRKEMEPSTRAVNAAFKDFIGVNAIKRAREMVDAVKRLSEDQKELDGVTKLTEASQRKLNAAVTQAISHYTALGKEAPADLLKIAAATSKVEAGAKQVGILGQSFAQLTASFTAANLISKAVTSVLDLGAGAVKSAGQIVDLSKKTGLSIEGVQRLGFVAKQSGGSLESIADAVFKASVKIEQGSTKTRDAIAALGLSFADIKAMKPEDQFDAIMRALAAIEDPQKRNALGVAALGKAYESVAASVDDYVEAMKNAPVAGEEAVKATDEAADAIERAWDQAEKSALDAIGNIILAWERGRKAAQDAGQGNIGRGIAAAGVTNPFFSAATLGATLGAGLREPLGLSQTKLPAVPKPAMFDFTAKPPAIQPVKDYVAELKKANLELVELTKQEKAQIAAAIQLGTSTEDIVNAMEEVRDGAGISARAVEIFKDRLKESESASKQQAEAAKNLKSGLADLTHQQYAQIASLLDAGKAESDIAKVYGFTSQQIGDVKDNEKELADIRKNLASALQKQTKEMADKFIEQAKATHNLKSGIQDLSHAQYTQIAALLKAGKAEADIAKAYGFTAQQVKEVSENEKDLVEIRKKTAEVTKAVSKQMADNFIATRKLEMEAADLRDQRTMSSTQFQIQQVNEWAAQQKSAFIGTEEQAKRFYAAVDLVAKERIESIKTTWASAFSAIAGGFEQLANIMQGEMADLARSIGGASATVEILGTSFDKLKKASGLKETVAGIAGLAGAIAQAVSLAVDLGKALHDAFTRSESEKSAADIRRSGFDPDLADIGEDSDLAKKIAQMVKDLNIDRNLALELNLSDIVDVAGGIDSGNFAKFRDRAAELFDDIKIGGKVGQLAVEQLDKVMGQLGDHVVEVGGLWDEHFVDMLERAQAEGVELASVMKLLNDQLDRGGQAASQLAGGFVQELQQSAKSKTTDRQKAFDEEVKAAKGNAKAIEDIEKRRAAFLKGVNAEIVADSQDAYDRISRLALAAFNAFTANGGSVVDAAAALAPAIASLESAATEFGFAGNAAFNELKKWGTLVQENEGLLNQLGALEQLAVSLANTGSLTTQAFQDIQDQAQDIFQNLRKAGFTEEQALKQMEPLLKNIIKMHQDSGNEIDAETLALINQSKQYGLLQDEGLDTNNILMQGLAALIEALGGEVPAAWKEMLDKAKKDAQAMEDALNGIEVDPVHVPVVWDFDEPEFERPQGPNEGGGPTPGFKRGGFVDAGAGLLAMLHGKEWVVPHEDMADLIAAFSSTPSFAYPAWPSMVGADAGGELVAGRSRVPAVFVDSRVLGEISDEAAVQSRSRLGMGRV